MSQNPCQVALSKAVAGISGELGNTGAVTAPFWVDSGVGESFDFLLMGSEAVSGSGRPRFLVLEGDTLEILLGDPEPSCGSAVGSSLVFSVIEGTTSAAWSTESLLGIACCCCCVPSLISGPALKWEGELFFMLGDSG